MAKRCWPAVLMVLVPLCASAQTPAAGWLRRPPIGTNVTVVQTDGQKIKGRLVAANDSSVRLESRSGSRQLALEAIKTVRHHDLRPLRWAVPLGAGAGAALGWLSEASCGGQCMPSVAALAGAPLGAAFGAGVGLALATKIDYRAASRRSVSLAPILSRRTRGVAIAVRF